MLSSGMPFFLDALHGVAALGIQMDQNGERRLLKKILTIISNKPVRNPTRPKKKIKHFVQKMAYGPFDDNVRQAGVIKKTKNSSFSQYTQMNNNLRCCTLFAHTTGFAGIAGWKLRMHSDWFKDDPWHCATLIPIALVQYYVVIKLTQIGRRLFILKFVTPKDAEKPMTVVEGEQKKKDGEEDAEDALLEVLEDNVVDGENDFFGLFMSTLIVGTIKFRVGGLEEIEDEEYKFNRSLREALIMYAVAAAFFFSAFGLLVLRRNKEEQADEERNKKNSGEGGQKAGQAFYEKFSKSIWRCLPKDRDCTSFIINEGAKTIKRLGDLFVKILTMSYAWSFMYATQWFLGQFFKGEGSVLAISLAMTVSVFSVLQIFVLDRIADEDEAGADNENSSGTEDNEVLRTLLESIGILIGFVWESAFDDALEGIVGKDDIESLWVKPVLGILTVAVIFPVWRMYIVPMEVEKGYILGFTPSKVAHRMERVFNDPSIGKDVKDDAREILEEIMMVMLAFDREGPHHKAIKNHLEEYFKEQEKPKYQPPALGSGGSFHSPAEEQTRPSASEASGTAGGAVGADGVGAPVVNEGAGKKDEHAG